VYLIDTKLKDDKFGQARKNYERTYLLLKSANGHRRKSSKNVHDYFLCCKHLSRGCGSSVLKNKSRIIYHMSIQY